MSKIIKKIIYNDEENTPEKYGGTIFGDASNKANAQTALIQAEMASNGVLEVRKIVAGKASIGDLEAVNIIVGTKAGLDDIGQRNLIRNSKTMIFEDYGYDVEGGLTDENDNQLTDEEQTVLTDGTPARKDITTVPEASSIDVNNDSVFINQGDAIKQISLSEVLPQGDKHYTHTQDVSSDTWNVTHNMGKFPSITVIDSANHEVVGDYTYVDNNSVVLKFDSAFSGKAIFN